MTSENGIKTPEYVPEKPSLDSSNVETNEPKELGISQQHLAGPDSMIPSSTQTNGNGAAEMNVASTATNALHALKGAFTEAKLFTKQITGQIVESNDDPNVLRAFQKLDGYKEQISSLLQAATLLNENMEKTYQLQNFMVQKLERPRPQTIPLKEQQQKELNEIKEDTSTAGVTVITAATATTPASDMETKESQADSSRREKDSSPMDSNHVQNYNADNDSKEKQEKQPQQGQTSFDMLCAHIATHLRIEQQHLEKRVRKARTCLVTPLQNVLSREINHAIEMRAKYSREKRHYDDVCTTIDNLKKKLTAIHQMEQQQQQQQQQQQPSSPLSSPQLGAPVISNTTATTTAAGGNGAPAKEEKSNLTSRFKTSWARFSKAAEPTRTKDSENNNADDAVNVNPENKGEYERKLKEARDKYKLCVKSFETTRQQFLECIDLIDSKLNLETEHYFKQFDDFLEKSAIVQDTV